MHAKFHTHSGNMEMPLYIVVTRVNMPSVEGKDVGILPRHMHGFTLIGLFHL